MSKYIYADDVSYKDPWKTWKNVDINGNSLDNENSSSNSESSDSSSSNSATTKSSKNIEITLPLQVLPRTEVTPTTADLNRVIIEKIH